MEQVPPEIVEVFQSHISENIKTGESTGKAIHIWESSNFQPSIEVEENTLSPKKKKKKKQKRCSCFGMVDSGQYVLSSKKVGAEFLGSFILIFSAAAGPIVNQKYNGVETLIGNAACSALAVMIVVLSIGHISGAHLNPSVTLAFATFCKFPWVQVPAYVTAQILASLCASFILKETVHPFISGGVTVPSVNTTNAFALEFIITFILMFVIFAVATDPRAVGQLAGIAIGGAVMLNILVAGPMTGASMNPIRTLGPAVAAHRYDSIWIYILAPTLGALAGAGAYGVVRITEEDIKDEE